MHVALATPLFLWGWLFACVFFAGVSVNAQDQATYLSPYPSYTAKDGVCSNECHFIFEDDRHYLWICTDEGLSRFDGKDFKSFEMKDGLPSSVVFRLKRLRSGRVVGWTLSGHLFELENDRIRTIPMPNTFYTRASSDRVIIDVLEDSVGNLYIGDDYWDGYAVLKTDGSVTFGPEERIEGDAVHIREVDGQPFIFLTDDSTTTGHFSVCTDRDTLSYSLPTRTLFNSKPLVLDGSFFWAFGGHLLKYRDGVVEVKDIGHVSINISPIDGKLAACYQDKGVQLFDPTTLEPISSVFMEEFLVTSIIRDSGGQKWATTLENGLIRVVYSIPFQVKSNLLEGMGFRKVCAGNDDDLYLLASTDAPFLCKLYHLKNGVFEKFDETITTGVRSSFFLDHVEQKLSLGISFGSLGQSFVSLNGEFHEGGLIGGSFRGLTEEHCRELDSIGYSTPMVSSFGDTVAFASKFKLCFLSNGALTHYPIQQAFPYIDIRALCSMGAQTMLGTRTDGLLIIDQDGVQQYDAKDGLLSSHVADVEMIGPGEVVVATNKGVNYLRKEPDGSWKIAGEVSAEAGWVETDIYDLALVNDTVWMISNEHLQGFAMRDFDRKSRGIDHTFISSILVGEDTINDGYDTPFPHTSNSIVFQIERIGLAGSGDRKALVRLIGLNDTWEQVGVGRIQYSNLKAGVYEFQLAADSKNVARSKVKTFRFEILRPIYEELWFIVLAVISVILLAVFSVRWAWRRKQKKIQRSHQVKQLKLQSLMAEINPHFTFNVINSIQSMILTENKYNVADKLADFSLMIRKLLEVTEHSMISLEREIDLLRDYMSFENMRLGDQFDVRVEVDPELNLVMVPPLLLQPLTENAIWHGIRKLQDRRGEIVISVTEQQGDLFFKITNDGDNDPKRKVTKKRHQKSKGVELVKERIKLVNEESGTQSRFSLMLHPNQSVVSFFLKKISSKEYEKNSSYR